MRTVLASLVILSAFGTNLAAAVPPSPPPPYTLTFHAYAGSAGTDVALQITAPAGRALPSRAETIVLVSRNWIKAYAHTPLTLGGWKRSYNDLPRGKAVKAYVTIRTSNPPGAQLLLANTVVLYRPDLKFDPISAPTSVRIGDLVTFPVLLRETKGDSGATCDVALRGSGVDPVTVPGVLVNPFGTTQLNLTTRFLALGPQTVTLGTQGQVPADFNPSDNTATFTVNVSPADAPTAYYGGYHRWEGIRSDTNQYNGSSITYSSDGRSETLYINATSTKLLSWPLDFTALALADGAPAITQDFTGIVPTGSFTDFNGLTEYAWIVDIPTGRTFRFLTVTGPGQQTGFYYARDAADYTYLQTQDGVTTISPLLFGTPINAEVHVSLFGSLRSGSDQIGGWTPVLPITHHRVDEEGTIPPPDADTDPGTYSDHRDIWDAYGTGNLTP